MAGTIMENILIFLSGWVIAALINYLSEVLPYRRKLVASLLSGLPAAPSPDSITSFFPADLPGL
jgi:hypothetical protein